jgi:hypothetical protein
MTVDPSLALALSVHSNPGVYALLLGSGLSRSAGVPTGWEIVLDLIRKLALLKGEACEPDPETWYATAFSSDPDYSEILAGISKSSTERMQLLRSYFEPSQTELDEGRKQPTPAHRAIAELVTKGYIRVIVTTNFDRLMEQALVDLGVQPVVISTTDSAVGALPLAHSRCTVIKVNGDYLDSRLKNTRDELARYEEPIDRLLDRVFDEYGLVICGWSGDWDTALRAALERCSTRRFTMYWASRSKLGLKAQDLVTLRQATTLDITSADDFFKEVLEKVSALEHFAATDVLSTKVAVARLKKYIANDSQRINLYDLLTSETEKLHAAINSERFSARTTGLSVSDVPKRLQFYESAVDTVLHLMVCASYWDDEKLRPILLKCFKRVADIDDPQSSFVIWNKLRRYPSLVLLYGIGLAALSRGNYRLTHSLLQLKLRQDRYKPEELVVAAIHCQAVLELGDQHKAFGKQPRPLNDRLFALLREPMRDYLPDDHIYDETFDWLEYLLALSHCDANATRADLQENNSKDPNFTLWAPVGRFGFKTAYGSPGIQQETEFHKGEPLSDKVRAVIAAGFFESAGQHDDKFQIVKAAFDRLVGQVRFQSGVL